jgi:hypothetical protein
VTCEPGLAEGNGTLPEEEEDLSFADLDAPERPHAAPVI